MPKVLKRLKKNAVKNKKFETYNFENIFHQYKLKIILISF